ncbi:MAG: sigma-54-dependent Fis family transcriptional regulator [Desulfobacula sp.]|nr:sigma-54-dependent Fis family transcriptional regulator [Desulfobacula sp.]
MENILIVDDEKNYPMIIKELLQEEGYTSLTASSGMEALDILNTELIDLVLTDVKMPGMSGIQLLKEIKKTNPDLPVIIMTAYGSVEKAVDAMHMGAYTFILKPFENQALIAYIAKAISVYRIVQENSLLREAISSRYSFDNIIGKSKPMQEIYEIIKKVAPSNASVLIEGESGTGKELVAKSIHYNSPRKSNPLIAVNCSAFAETLLESELFGHEKGAFTGAATLKKGRFELSDKGSLFLDEIGELPISLQVKLLRVLQEKTIERVGGTAAIPVDFRLIAATNKNLEDEVEKGKFREDLFYRLNVVRTIIPPLRERSEDIPLLVKHFIDKYTKDPHSASTVSGINPEAIKILYDYQWKGNVRELENIIERAVIFCNGTTITPSDLPLQVRQNMTSTLDLNGIPEGMGLAETLTAVEKRMIQRAMKISGNVHTKAAQLLGIGKSGLNQKLKKFNLDK